MSIKADTNYLLNNMITIIINERLIMKTLCENEIKVIELDILKWFDEFCSSHNLQYFIYAGTLLGAVRHHGFIPWDDDIDIIMFRKEYEDLVNIVKKNNKDRYFFLLPELESNYYYTFGKLIDSKTILKESYTGKAENLGVYIDIFILDTDIEDIKQRKKDQKILEKMIMVLSFFTSRRHSSKGFKRLVAEFCSKFSFLINKNKMKNKCIQYAAKYRNNNSILVSSRCGGAYNENTVYKREWFSNKVYMKFEGIDFPAPFGYHELLSKMYGNYMELPPKNQRISNHFFEASWK